MAILIIKLLVYCQKLKIQVSKMFSSKIISTGSYLPTKIYNNNYLASIVDTSDEWITERTGIKERHIADENEMTTDLALQASINAINNCNIDKNSIENTVYELLLDESSLENCIYDSVMDGLKVIPSNINLSGAEIELISIENKEFIITNIS